MSNVIQFSERLSDAEEGWAKYLQSMSAEQLKQELVLREEVYGYMVEEMQSEATKHQLQRMHLFFLDIKFMYFLLGEKSAK